LQWNEQDIAEELKLNKGIVSSELLRRAIKEGNSLNVDLLVKDIYGDEGTQGLGLPPQLLASSMGKSKD
jgi:pantothenate kinase